MNEMHQDNSLALDLCGQCQGRIHEHDKYCRHCGRCLSESTARMACIDEASRAASRKATREVFALSPYATAPLNRLECSRPVTGPLIQFVTTGLTRHDDSRVARRLMLVLISFPIWLMMVLLSPLDAYAATKAIGRQL